MRKPNGYWSKERCKEEALKYNTRKEFHDKSSSAATRCIKNGWLDEVCSHMKEICKPRNYWTKEKCQEESLKYTNRTEFQINIPSAYISSRKNGWLNEICSHMTELIKPDGYWTKEKCLEEALKYNKRGDYSKNPSYQQALSKGWLDDICVHMESIGSKYKRCIYVYEFEDNSAYVGLTFDLKKRHDNHLSNSSSSVYKKINEKLKYEFKKLTKFIDIDEAKKLENYYVNEYKNKGWNILNKSKTGGLGGKFIKWTKEKCIIEALNYKNKSELKRKNGSVYNLIVKNNWQDEMFTHMISSQKPTGYWTQERCINEALKYKSRSEFKKNSTAYSSCQKKGWLDIVCVHMK